MGLKPRPMEESNLHRPRPLGEVRRTVRAKYLEILGCWQDTGRMAREAPPRYGAILPARNW